MGPPASLWLEWRTVASQNLPHYWSSGCCVRQAEQLLSDCPAAWVVAVEGEEASPVPPLQAPEARAQLCGGAQGPGRGAGRMEQLAEGSLRLGLERRGEQGNDGGAEGEQTTALGQEHFPAQSEGPV